jgi:hypothetical protein
MAGLKRRVTRRRLTAASGALLAGCVLLAASCSSGPKQLSGTQLAAKVIPAPYGYQVDGTKNASGYITPDVFDQFGGFGSPSKVGFVAGFKQNYVDYDSEEGISVTVLEFQSRNSATSYLSETANDTLSFASATHKPFHQIPGAVEADGTKPYGGEYSHGVVMTAGRFYIQLVYVTSEPATPPIEFANWAKAQYQMLE